MFKDARLQERIFDQIHKVEFDMEDVPTTEVGSLLSTERPTTGSFQRIDDSDIAASADESETAYVQETVAAHVGAFIDEIKEETAGTPQTFERVSDDEGAGAEGEEAKGRRTKRAATKRGAKKEVAADKEPKTKRSGSKAPATKSAAKKSSKKAASKKSGKSRKAANLEGEGETDIAVLEAEAARAESADLVASEAADGEHFEAGSSGDDADYKDAEATLSSGRTRAEFATRRGGRRRRRPTKQQDANGEDRTNGKDEGLEAV